MPVWGVLLVRLRDLPDAAELNAWRRDLLIAFEPGDFSHDGPLKIIGPDEEWRVHDLQYGGVRCVVGTAGAAGVTLDLIRERGDSVWLDVRCVLPYYGRGYERGEPEYFVRVSEWLESRIPGCEVWYEPDTAEDAIGRFGAPERAGLLDYFQQVGHGPYDGRFRQAGGP